MRLDYTRQQGIVDQKLLAGQKITLIGAGAIGSFTALTLAKMGVEHISVYDDDGVTEHNLPNQFYRKQDVGQYKVDALREILGQFSDAVVVYRISKYINQIIRLLQETVIVATDSMASRKIVWEQFKRQPQCRNLIEARMGAEVGMVYTIRKGEGPEKRLDVVQTRDVKFYEARLHSDAEVKPLPCTARSIIYNVLMVSSLVCRAYKGILTGERVPREMIFNLTSIGDRTFMYTR